MLIFNKIDFEVVTFLINKMMNLIWKGFGNGKRFQWKLDWRMSRFK